MKKIIFFIIIGIIMGYGLGYSIHPKISSNKSLPIVLTQAQHTESPLYNLEESFIGIAEEVKPAVVNLRIEKKVKGAGRWGTFFHDFEDRFFKSPFDDLFGRFFDEFEQEHKIRSLGSGLIVDKQGYILTNHHVIQGADEIKVKLIDGREFDGKVKGTDSKTDLALIKIEARDSLPVVRLGDSDKVKIGSWAIAIGNPFGLEHTVTIGVVSAKGRAIGATTYEDFIQTDASINPGNSGGPLVNLRGEVIGINTAIVAGGQGIGFAIPINMAKQVIDALITKGKVTRAWLGVTIQDLTEELARHFNVKPREGVVVADIVKDSPADRAGFREGDIIKKIDEKAVSQPRELQREVAKKIPGDSARLTVLRNGRERTLIATLEEMPSQPERISQKETPSSSLGIIVQNLTPSLARRYKLDEKEKGVIITDIQRGSFADVAGLQVGDLIKEINHKRINNLEDFEKGTEKIDQTKGMLFLINRAGQKTFISLTIR